MTPNQVILFVFITLLITPRVYSSRQSKIENNPDNQEDTSSESESETEDFLELASSKRKTKEIIKNDFLHKLFKYL